MTAKISETSLDFFTCVQSESALPVILFFLGAGALTIVVARYNTFTLKQSIMAALGLLRFRRTLLINLLHAATLIIPLGLWVWLSDNCAQVLHNASSGVPVGS